MRLLSSILLFALSCTLAAGANVSEAAYQRWHGDKYSMFIHFGLYSELGGVWNGQRITSGYSEQIQSHAGIFSDYYAEVAERFTPSSFNAEEIVSLAKKAGMRSIVITSKHHDGFCLWHTATTDFNAWDATPVPRDFIKNWLKPALVKVSDSGCTFLSLTGIILKPLLSQAAMPTR
jgi:Alpha-L-fucosidase